MNLYRLQPLNSDAPEWKLSSWQEPAIIRAPNERVARIAASLAFANASKDASGLLNPWRLVEAVECSVVGRPVESIVYQVSIVEPAGYGEALKGIVWDAI